MSKAILFSLVLIFLQTRSFSQQSISSYVGNWEGHISGKKDLNFKIRITDVETDYPILSVSNDKVKVTKKGVKDQTGISFEIEGSSRLELKFSSSKAMLSGFFTSGILMYHVDLNHIEKGIYEGYWNPFLVEELISTKLFISVEEYEDGNFALYPFFNDQRFSGTFAAGFRKEGDAVTFTDFKTGFRFKALLQDDEISIELIFIDTPVSSAILKRSTEDWVFGNYKDSNDQNVNTPKQLKDGWTTANLKTYDFNAKTLKQLITDVQNEELENTHGIAIAKNGELVFEAYFDQHHREIPHDLRSASKSISAAMTGIAIDEGIFSSVEERVLPLLPEKYRRAKDERANRMKIKDLLTMSSGIDAIDFGINRQSLASEDSYQNSPDWLATVMTAPMIEEPGTKAFYGSANPFLLGVILDEKTETPVELFMDERLMQPLGITNYIIQTENTSSTPYFGGGMHMTIRDMLKFGQLYLNGGKWEGRQIIPSSFVAKSFEKLLILENTPDQTEYGYLWWHETYNVDRRKIASIEARGAGGQYICVVPELDLVVAITSGNFRNGKFAQPERIMGEYILPALIKK